MDTNGPVGGDLFECETSKKKTNRSKTVWDPDTFKEFIDLCFIEDRKGNRPGTTFTKDGWSNLVSGMCEKTGKKFEKKKLSNKWDQMKKEWKIYESLTRHETGLGGTRKLIDASDEWWDEKIKVDKKYAKFKNANLEVFESIYAPLFRGTVAVGDQTMAPSQFQNDSDPDNVQCEEDMEGKGDSDEINLAEDEPIFPSFPESSSSKRKKQKDVGNSRSTKSKTSAFEEKLEVVMDALSSRSTQTFPPDTPSPTLADCMKIVTTFPDFQAGSKKYSRALLAFTKKANREAFMFPDNNEDKMEFLKLLVTE